MRNLLSLLLLALLITTFSPCIALADDDKEPQTDEERLLKFQSKIQELENRKFEACRLLAQIYEQNGQQDKALEKYAAAWEMKPEDRTIAEKLMYSYIDKKKWDKLIPIYEQMIKSRPDYNYYFEMLGICYMKIGKAEKAWEIWNTYLKANAFEGNYQSLGSNLRNYQMNDEAIKVFEEGIKKFPENYYLHYYLAQTYVNKKLYKEALKEYEAALRLTNDEYQKQQMEREIITIYKQAGMLNEIIKSKEDSLTEIDDKLPEFYLAVAQIFEKKKLLQEALSFYKKLVTIYPDTEQGKKAAERVKELDKESN